MQAFYGEVAACVAFYSLAVNAGSSQGGVCAAADARIFCGNDGAGAVVGSAALAAAAGGAGAYVDAEAVLAAASVGDAYAGAAKAGAVALAVPVLRGVQLQVLVGMDVYVAPGGEVAAADVDVAACHMGDLLQQADGMSPPDSTRPAPLNVPTCRGNCWPAYKFSHQ